MKQLSLEGDQSHEFVRQIAQARKYSIETVIRASRQQISFELPRKLKRQAVLIQG